MHRSSYSQYMVHGERKTKTMYEKQFTAIEGPHSYIIALNIYFTLTVRSRDQNDGQFHTSTKHSISTHTQPTHSKAGRLTT